LPAIGLRGNFMENLYRVTLTWDDEAEVWIATSSDVYGLILEHESIDLLLNRVRLAIPELLAFENCISGDILLKRAGIKQKF